ncbi:MAG: MetQ/NlpA family ABC transporter substrate-binding protein, partial [Proteobacteria bacterium]|nr:MetQ/NlpA family ABC transporter substrate-binding protein [Pseudomonadota bacterium]
MKKILLVTLLTVGVLSLTACSPKKINTIKVGTIDGPETQLMEAAKEVAKKNYDLNVQIVPFSDYNTPNAALNDGSITANAFQTQPYLDAQAKQYGYHFATVGKTFVYPVGIYSQKIKDIHQVPDKAKVAIPNDPSNGARSLLLLQKAGLITLKPGVTINATKFDIVANPKHLQIIELDAPQLPRSLSDVDLAIINTNYAVGAGLSPIKDAIFHEDANSPYVNIIV